ncbi:MAG: cyanophycinase [Thermaurantiacus sp.]
MTPRLALLALALAAAPAAAAPGTLVIAGGAVSADNDAVWQSFLLARPADAPTIVIVPAASSSPARAARAAATTLINQGAAPEDIRILHLATVDDEGTADVDESQWSGNARSEAELAKLANAGAIWFTGGDQSRITATLLERDGSDTPMLALMRARLGAGAVIGGTSAGAAIMSPMMITRGDSLIAMLAPVLRDGIGTSGRDGGQMAMAVGLGFFPWGIVDQHFDRRARLGRLSRALLAPGMQERYPRGFGIDENTAMVVNLATGEARAVGAGSVTLVDSGRATSRDVRGRLEADDLRLGLANSGDRIAIATMEVTPAAFKQPLSGREYHNHQVSDGGGMAIAGQTVEEVLGNDLLDNRGTRRLERLTLSGNEGVLFRFTQTDDSRGWLGTDPDGRPRYSISGVDFAIRPVRVRVAEVRR